MSIENKTVWTARASLTLLLAVTLGVLTFLQGAWTEIGIRHNYGFVKGVGFITVLWLLAVGLHFTKRYRSSLFTSCSLIGLYGLWFVTIGQL
jgi:hypothetical protein